MGLRGGTGAQAEVFTLTDKQERSIQADVLSVDGDTIRIKRTDGLLFDLDLRAEYILFTGAAPRPQRTNISPMPIGTIVSRDRAVFKSGTTLLVKTSYKGEMGRPAGDTLYGIWLRIYHHDVLIHESSSPEILRQTGTW